MREHLYFVTVPAMLLTIPIRWWLASLELRLWFARWPDRRAAWAAGVFTSTDVLGIKLGDVLWWTVVGAVHPLAMAHCAAVVPASLALRAPPSKELHPT